MDSPNPYPLFTKLLNQCAFELTYDEKFGNAPIALPALVEGVENNIYREIKNGWLDILWYYREKPSLLDMCLGVSDMDENPVVSHALFLGLRDALLDELRPNWEEEYYG